MASTLPRELEDDVLKKNEFQKKIERTDGRKERRRKEEKEQEKKTCWRRVFVVKGLSVI